MVFTVKRLGAEASIVVSLVQAAGRSGSEVLRALEQLGGATLSLVPVDGGGLVFEVKDEPQLDAGVGHHDVHAVLARERQRLGHVWMNVAVEHAPHRVVGAASPAAGLSIRGVLLCDGTLDKCERRSTSSVDRDDDAVAKVTPQWKQVAVLGLGPFNQYQQLRSWTFLALPAWWP